MSSKKRPLLDYERRGAKTVAAAARSVAWTTNRDLLNDDLDAAWRTWLADERKRRGNPNWHP